MLFFLKTNLLNALFYFVYEDEVSIFSLIFMATQYLRKTFSSVAKVRTQVCDSWTFSGTVLSSQADS